MADNESSGMDKFGATLHKKLSNLPEGLSVDEVLGDMAEHSGEAIDAAIRRQQAARRESDTVYQSDLYDSWVKRRRKVRGQISALMIIDDEFRKKGAAWLKR